MSRCSLKKGYISFIHYFWLSPESREQCPFPSTRISYFSLLETFSSSLQLCHADPAQLPTTASRGCSMRKLTSKASKPIQAARLGRRSELLKSGQTSLQCSNYQSISGCMKSDQSLGCQQRDQEAGNLPCLAWSVRFKLRPFSSFIANSRSPFPSQPLLSTSPQFTQFISAIAFIRGSTHAAFTASPPPVLIPRIAMALLLTAD